jgi:hypothetical protein
VFSTGIPRSRNAPLSLGFQPRDMSLRQLLPAPCIFLLPERFTPAGSVVARPHNRVGRIDKKTTVTQRVEQIPIMTDQEADSAIITQSRDEHRAGIRIYMIGGLVESQYGRLLPKYDRDLGPLSFAMAE